MVTLAAPIWWIVFGILVMALLAIDLGVFHRRAHVVHAREALLWTAAWIGVSLAFNAGVYFVLGPGPALEFLTGYLIEKALSVDNLFVILVIFSYFAVPEKLQHRVLFWGIVGALLTRGIFIFAGSALLAAFHFIEYVFGGFLVITGIRLLLHRNEEIHPEKNLLLRWSRKVIPTVSDYRGGHFSVVENGKRYATPLFLALITIEATDVVFAVDSIPAVFAVTRDPFIVFTSNIFAILGLRSLYFVLAAVLGKLRYLKVGLSLILAFVGGKMLLGAVYEIPVLISLAVVVLLLGGSIVASLLNPAPADTKGKSDADGEKALPEQSHADAHSHRRTRAASDTKRAARGGHP